MERAMRVMQWLATVVLVLAGVDAAGEAVDGACAGDGGQRLCRRGLRWWMKGRWGSRMWC